MLSTENEEQLDAEGLASEAIQRMLKFANSGNLRDAELIADQLLKTFSEDARIMRNCGVVKQHCDKIDEAIVLYQKTLKHEPDNHEVLNNLGLCFGRKQRPEDAVETIRRAIECQPKICFYWNNLSVYLRFALRFDEAIEAVKVSLDIDPKCAVSWCILGGLYGECERFDEAKPCLQRAIELNPEFCSAYIDLFYLEALHGRWASNWHLYEKRTEVFEQVLHWKRLYGPDKVLKKGENVSGKRIVLFPEQGAGDTLHFIRYAPELKKRGATVILHAYPDMRELLAPMVDEVFTKQDGSLPEHDFYCSLISLPYLLELTEIPPAPYLRPKKTCCLPPSKAKLRIGIAWAGNPQHPNDRWRSCYLTEFRKLQEIEGVELYSLQKDIRARTYGQSDESIDLTKGSENMQIINLAEHLTDYETTAAIVQALDLIVCVDTSLLHLAGALGKPAFAMIPVCPDWRWTLHGSDTAWYPSVKLFRQTKRGDWSGVMEKIAEEIRRMT